jgi:hypothetical protein
MDFLGVGVLIQLLLARFEISFTTLAASLAYDCFIFIPHE